jgi:hypothetical protein
MPEASAPTPTYYAPSVTVSAYSHEPESPREGYSSSPAIDARGSHEGRDSPEADVPADSNASEADEGAVEDCADEGDSGYQSGGDYYDDGGYYSGSGGGDYDDYDD